MKLKKEIMWVSSEELVMKILLNLGKIVRIINEDFLKLRTNDPLINENILVANYY